MHSIEDKVSCFFLNFKLVRRFIVFGLLFLYLESSFKVVRVYYMYCCCLGFVSCNCYLLGWGNMCEMNAL